MTVIRLYKFHAIWEFFIKGFICLLFEIQISTHLFGWFIILLGSSRAGLWFSRVHFIDFVSNSAISSFSISLYPIYSRFLTVNITQHHLIH